MRTRFRYERLVDQQLPARGVEALLPLVERPRRRVARWNIASCPLLLTSVLPVDSHPDLKDGMEVQVRRVPLEGPARLLVRKGRRARLVVAVHLIQQAASVELDTNDVRGLR